jgi:hypothetical protein
MGLEGIAGFIRTVLAGIRQVVRRILGRTDDDRPAI